MLNNLICLSRECIAFTKLITILEVNIMYQPEDGLDAVRNETIRWKKWVLLWKKNFETGYGLNPNATLIEAKNHMRANGILVFSMEDGKQYDMLEFLDFLFAKDNIVKYAETVYTQAVQTRTAGELSGAYRQTSADVAVLVGHRNRFLSQQENKGENEPLLQKGDDDCCPSSCVLL